MAVTGLYKDIFAENSQTFIMSGQQGLVYRFELNLAHMKYMPKTRVNQVPRFEIQDLRSMIQHNTTRELVQTTQDLLDHTLTEGVLNKYQWGDYSHMLFLAQEGGQMTVLKGLHKPNNQVSYVPHYRIQSSKEVILDYAIFPSYMNMERSPSYFLKLEQN